MYKFLMVDDEELVRRGFETKIDWAEAGFEFLPPCENGRDALAAIDELEPDVVMTDIRMPHVDGISVAAHVNEKHPGIVVIILSGHDDFAYAQAAIRHNVFDYVLKPVSSRDLATLLVKIKAKLDADRRFRDDETELKLKADITSDILRERNLTAFLAGDAGTPSAEEAAVLLGFDPGTLACTALVAEGDGAAEEGASGELRSRLAQALRVARRSAAFFPSECRAAALIFELGRDRSFQAARTVASVLLEGGRATLRIGVGREYDHWIDAPRTYAEAVAALSYRLVRQPVRPFFYAQGSEAREARDELRSHEERLCLALRTGAVFRVPELSRSYVEALDRADLSPQRVRHEILAFFSRAHDELGSIGVSTATLSAELTSDYYRFVESLDTAESVNSTLLRIAEVAASVLEESSFHEPEWKVLDFKEYVARHYADKGLSIGKAAERLSISESYLSKLLRRRLGTSFVEYLSDYRIDRAKEFLATSDMLTYEVAEAVGYPDARYFASLFKKKTSMTPSEYRKALDRGVQTDGT
jgi:two-component system response regulator YesN